ncbi:UDP-N-acetylmuramoyl-L-alanyl-D-glutamate--2,6-diaminopimelate ligase [Ilumatobacter sp.]|uniref:UDP-N-acetylmuramoyl-L-alanyl-D-glutamate--2, 6-diaminopimelate ligase n=1 Tax=Ilumatobacter sp. TaxID=1967498 RepID=UPI003B51F5D5
MASDTTDAADAPGPADAAGTTAATSGVAPVTVGALASRLEDSAIAARIVGDGAATVVGATHDSRAVGPGQLFACLRGESFDGHRFAGAAVEQGAGALLVDHDLGDEAAGRAQIVVDDTRRAVGHVASLAWGDPSRELATVGITGTNGKTTTAQIVAAMLDAAGRSAGVIGTLHGPRTTPEAPELASTLRGFVARGERAAVMEVSSHALALHRVDGTRFDVVAFTNLGHDHLDLHGSPEAYFRAKSALFDAAFAPVAVIDVDDPHGSVLADAVGDRTGPGAMRVVEVSVGDLDELSVGVASHSYRWRGRRVEVPLGGDFNVANSLLAVSIVAELDVDLDAALGGLSRLEPVRGRFEVVASPIADERGVTVVVDYAHTPDGLERVLEAARAVARGRVVAVFGCAGGRDREKRPVMGRIAARLADVAIATSDNPRGEDPVAILDEVVAGVEPRDRSTVTAQPDRRLAIREALAVAHDGDVVVIAGKGHERTQDLGHDVIDFDDREVALEELHP